MKTVTSKDGTTIAFDQSGQGSVVILIGGALQSRAFDQGLAPLADRLSQHFTVIYYDRRGRGDSTDAQPNAFEREAMLAREIDDLEAVIDASGGSAFVYGISSGGALALEAAAKLGHKIRKLAIYEVPYNDDETAQQGWRQYLKELRELLAADRKGDAVGLFMRYVGAPADQVEAMRQHPMWPLWEGVAPSLAYDHIGAMGENSTIPTQRAARVAVPTLILTGSASFPFMQGTAKALVETIPNAQHHTLEGQTHEVAPEALAPVLIEFFKV